MRVSLLNFLFSGARSCVTLTKSKTNPTQEVVPREWYSGCGTQGTVLRTWAQLAPPTCLRSLHAATSVPRKDTHQQGQRSRAWYPLPHYHPDFRAFVKSFSKKLVNFLPIRIDTSPHYRPIHFPCQENMAYKLDHLVLAPHPELWRLGVAPGCSRVQT